MTKKELWESKVSQREKSLTESYNDMTSATMTDGTQVMASGSTRSTRTYNYEDVTFKFSGGHGEGSYRWLNRPWQRFDFADALIDAMIDAGVAEEFARECIAKTNNLDKAVEYFAKNYKSMVKEASQNDDHKTIRDNGCDRLALTQYEGGEPISFTVSDKELEDWLNADSEHSWFPVNLENDGSEQLKEEDKNVSNYDKAFHVFLNTIEFELVKTDESNKKAISSWDETETEGTWALHDLQGGNLADIEAERFENASDIAERLDTYIGDYFLRDEEYEDLDIESLEDLITKVPDHPFKDVFDMLVNHIEEVDLNKVYELQGGTSSSVGTSVYVVMYTKNGSEPKKMTQAGKEIALHCGEKLAQRYVATLNANPQVKGVEFTMRKESYAPEGEYNVWESEQIEDEIYEIELRAKYERADEEDSVEEMPQLEEAHQDPKLLDAVMDAFGFTKEEANEYIKKASDKTKKELVKGFKQDAKKNFYESKDDDLKKELEKEIRWCNAVLNNPNGREAVDAKANYGKNFKASVKQDLAGFQKRLDKLDKSVVKESNKLSWKEKVELKTQNGKIVKFINNSPKTNDSVDYYALFDKDGNHVDKNVDFNILKKKLDTLKESGDKEEVEEDKEYRIEYWSTEEDRDEGFGEIFIDSFDDKDEAIRVARKMVDRDGIASVEVFNVNSPEEIVFGYDGVKTWNESKEIKESTEKQPMSVDAMKDLVDNKYDITLEHAVQDLKREKGNLEDSLLGDERSISMLMSRFGLSHRDVIRYLNYAFDGKVIEEAQELKTYVVKMTGVSKRDEKEMGITGLILPYEFKAKDETDARKQAKEFDSKKRIVGVEVKEELKEAQGKKEDGVEFVIFDASKEGKAPILNIRSTRVEAEFLKNKLEKTGKYETVSFDEAPKGRFKKGDDFWGPFNDKWEKTESKVKKTKK